MMLFRPQILDNQYSYALLIAYDQDQFNSMSTRSQRRVLDILLESKQEDLHTEDLAYALLQRYIIYLSYLQKPTDPKPKALFDAIDLLESLFGSAAWLNEIVINTTADPNLNIYHQAEECLFAARNLVGIKMLMEDFADDVVAQESINKIKGFYDNAGRESAIKNHGGVTTYFGRPINVEINHLLHKAKMFPGYQNLVEADILANFKDAATNFITKNSISKMKLV